MDSSQIKLLVHSDTTDGSQVFLDSSAAARVITPVGNVQHSIDQAKFGATSIKFDGSGDYLTVPYVVADFSWWLGCTVEAWVYATSWSGWDSGAKPALIGNISPTSIIDYWSFGPLSAGTLGVYYYTGSARYLATVSTIPTGVWTHIRMCVSGGIIYLFIGGVLSAQAAVIGTPQSSATFPLSIGQYNNICIEGCADEILYTTEELSTADFTPPPAPYSSQISVYYEQQQKITTLLGVQQTQLLGMAPRLYHQVTQILASARRLNLGHDQFFDTAIPLHLQHEQVFHGMSQVALAFAQVFRGYGPAVALEFIQTWASHGYNLAFLPFVQLIGSQLGTVLQEIQFSVTVAGVRVGVTDCQFDRDDFCQIATLTLADKRDYDNKQVFDNVVITVCGEQFRLIVVDKPYDEQIQQGSMDRGYIIECASITCQLSESINDTVRATRITASFPAGTMATEVLAAITDGICSASLNVTDFQIGGYDFDDAVRIDALRQVFPEGGDYPWIIETDGDGVLQISSWAVAEFGGPGKKTLQLKQKQLTPPEGILYTQVSLKNYNQGDGQTGLTMEVVDNGDGTGIIYGYSVPWTDAFSIFDSDDSSAPSLLIAGGAVEDVEVEDTDVEFVDFAANQSKPCYSDPVIDWGNNDSLSPVTYTESGALTTATEPGYSVAVTVTYQTRRKKWSYDNRKIDVSQVRLRYD